MYDAILLAVLLALTLALVHYCRKSRLLSATRVACSEPAQRAVRLPGVVADRGAVARAVGVAQRVAVVEPVAGPDAGADACPLN